MKRLFPAPRVIIHGQHAMEIHSRIVALRIPVDQFHSTSCRSGPHPTDGGFSGRLAFPGTGREQNVLVSSQGDLPFAHPGG